MSYEPWNENSFLVRFEHILENDEDVELSKPVTFTLSQVFPGNFEFAEVTLAANQWIEDFQRRHFREEGSQARDVNFKDKLQAKLSDLITLNPMEIRTFIMSPSGTAEVTVALSRGTQSQAVVNCILGVVLLVILRNYLMS